MNSEGFIESLHLRKTFKEDHYIRVHYCELIALLDKEFYCACMGKSK